MIYNAFFISVLIVTLLYFSLWQNIAAKVKFLDFYITLGIGCIFMLASIIFVATNGKTSA